MRNTTLCYIEHDDKYLMLLRNKKKVDENKGKWIGVGGKFEENESPDECLIREVFEETNLTLSSYSLRGIVTFVSDQWGCEQMFLYTAGITQESYESFIDSDIYKNCQEGELKWIPRKEILSLNLWEGDKAFMKLLEENAPFFTMKLVYQGDDLTEIKTRIENL